MDNSLLADAFADDDDDILGDGGLGEHDGGCYYDDGPSGVLEGGGLDDGGGFSISSDILNARKLMRILKN